MPCPNFSPSRCPECTCEANLVPPDMGPYYDDGVALFGEAPGKDEDATGRPFVGKAGKETNEHYLKLAGLDRDETYFSNTVKCRPRNNKTPNPKLLESCSQWHVKSEMRHIKPRIVVLLGATACSMVPGIDLDMHHGIPREGEFFGHKCTIVPMFHPAAGMHDYKYMIPLREDFARLKSIIRGSYEGIARDQYPNPDYREILNVQDLKHTLAGEFMRPMAIDTEYVRNRNTGFRKEPYCLSYSVQPGTGYVISRKRTELLKEFNRYVKLWREVFVFHNAPADLNNLKEMGVDIPEDRIDDTMTRAYNLGTMFRLGLKVLAYRLCGVEMQEFEDLVRPYAHIEAVDYLSQLSKDEWPKPEGWNKRAWSLNTYVKRCLGDLEKCEDPSKVHQIVLGRWDDWPDEIVQPAIDKYGPMPQPSIVQVPWRLVVPYAGRDADTTLRLRAQLIKEAITIRRVGRRWAA